MAHPRDDALETVGLATVALGDGEAVALGDGEAVALGDGEAVALGDGEAVAIGDGEAVALGDGEAVALGDGEAVALGDGLAEGTLFRATPLFHKSFFLDLTQVNFFPLKVAVFPIFEQVAPAFTAA